MASEHYSDILENGNDAYKTENYDDAITAYEDVLSADYSSAAVYYNLGNAYYKTGQIPDAILHYEKALKIDPKHKGALEYQGEMFITLGQLDKAKANLKKLNSICFLGCSEETALKNSIENSQKGLKNNY